MQARKDEQQRLQLDGLVGVLDSMEPRLEHNLLIHRRHGDHGYVRVVWKARECTSELAAVERRHRETQQNGEWGTFAVGLQSAQCMRAVPHFADSIAFELE